MKKIRTTITISKDLVKKTKKNNIKISTFLDRKLREYIAIINSEEFISDKSFTGKDISGYDVAHTTRRSPVQFRPDP